MQVKEAVRMTGTSERITWPVVPPRTAASGARAEGDPA